MITKEQVKQLRHLLRKAKIYIALLESCSDGYYQVSRSKECKEYEEALSHNQKK